MKKYQRLLAQYRESREAWGGMACNDIAFAVWLITHSNEIEGAIKQAARKKS